jgi:HEPN domain-containing protein
MKETEREAKRWYQQALDDMRFAEWVLHEGRFFDKGCFVVQQAGEKVLQSCLYGTGSRRVYGHSLFDACTELRSVSPSFTQKRISPRLSTTCTATSKPARHTCGCSVSTRPNSEA